jgi:hypothetical protein
VIKNDDLRASLAAGARKQAVTEFDVETYRHRIERVFSKALLKRLENKTTLPEVHQTTSEIHI